MKKRLLCILLVLVLIGSIGIGAAASPAETTVWFDVGIFQCPLLFPGFQLLIGSQLIIYRDSAEAHRFTMGVDFDPIEDFLILPLAGTTTFTLRTELPSGWTFNDSIYRIREWWPEHPQHDITMHSSSDGIFVVTVNNASEVVEISVFADIYAVPCEGTQPPSHPFADIAEGTWYHNAVQHVFQNEIMNGTSATAFSPQSSLNRAMVATVLSRIGDNPSISFRPIFHDVSPGQWYSGPITWAHDRGVVTGMPDGSFVPGRNIPTEQLAVMIHRYAESRGLNLAVPNHVTAPAGTSDWAAEAMGWAIHNGFLRSHNPHAPATRAETAYFVYRFSVHYGL